MKQACRICTTRYDYCHPCAITKDPFKNAGYCGEECYHISMILQKYGSHVISAEETIAELQPYGIDDKQLQPKIAEYYINIKQTIPSKPKKTRKSKNEIPIIKEIMTEEDTSSFITEGCMSDEDMETALDIE